MNKPVIEADNGERQRALSPATCSPAPASDATTAERELCNTLERIHKRYGGLGAFFDSLPNRRRAMENDQKLSHAAGDFRRPKTRSEN